MSRALRKLLHGAYAAACRAVDPDQLVRRAMSRYSEAFEVLEPGSRVIVLALGKASMAMSRAAVDLLGDAVSRCLIVTDTPGPAPRGADLIVAGHPVPNAASLEAGRRLLESAAAAGSEDLVLVLLSGGGSALAEDLPVALGLEDVAAATDVLLRTGAPIEDINVVRRHLSRLKGGGLLEAALPARVVTLALSDVVGNDVATIASGPTSRDATTPMDALAVIAGHRLGDVIPPRVVAHLRAAADAWTPRGDRGDGPVHVIGDVMTAGAAAADHLAAARFDVAGPEVFTGVAREAGAACAARLAEASPLQAWVGGGETTVHVAGGGRGGRNSEAALAGAIRLDAIDGVALMCAASDGIDGTSGSAGAIVDGETIARGSASDLDARRLLHDNDSAAFLEASGDLLAGGATGTNVGDVWAWLRAGG